VFLKCWLQENELAIEGYKEIDQLLIAVTSGKSLTNQQSQVCQRRFGITIDWFWQPCSATRATGSGPRFQRRVTKTSSGCKPARDPQ
jgi:hypothetical protein